jgi:acetylornithine deacetylase/succinyl-diaminopimelate desuccinylase-like protein
MLASPNLKRNLAVLMFFLFAPGGLLSAHEQPTSTRETIRHYRVTHEWQILQEFAQFLSIPNQASDVPNIERNAEAIVRMLQSRNISTQLLRTTGAPPAVFGTLTSPGATHTVSFYAHYDGQPADPKQWTAPPFSPVLRTGELESGGQIVSWSSPPEHVEPEWRLYARSASDDKAPIIGFMTALDALNEAKISLSVNIKFLFEGEEEIGSPHLETILSKYADLLKTDVWILCDGPVHQSGLMQVFFGARGTTDLDITVYGPNRGLHSGHYGNWAPNPIVLLTHLLDSMRDANANILIPGFYDDVRPLTAQERSALAQLPEYDEELKKELGLAWTEGGGTPLAEQILKPALNVRGIEAGHINSQAANVISTEAHASIDFRLVPNQSPGRVRDQVESHIARQGFFIVQQDPDAVIRQAHPRIVKLSWALGYPAARTSMDLPVSRAVVSVIERLVGHPIIKMPSLGGSIPMYMFQGSASVPVIGVPIANYDNNQHSANENIRLQNLWDGIDLYAALFAELGKAID